MRMWEFPKRIGSYNDYKNAALEFTKQICKNVFGLDDAFSSAATTLKRNLLKILREQEFSSAAADATEPSLILVLPDVTCDKCLSSTDLDICRDMLLNTERGHNTDQKGGHNDENWKCKYCDDYLNKGHIERRLVDLLNRRIVSYQLQDLKCVKCKMVKNSLVSRYCECTGMFTQI